MSKALKIIDGIIIAIFILMGAALLIPQFFGIRTTTVMPNMAGNVDVGSTIYARREPSTSIQTGDRMVDQDTDSINIYTVESFDPNTMTVTVSGGIQDTYTVSSNYLKVITVVPMIGYLLIATQSRDGLIILVLLLAFVIAVFIASEMIRKNGEAEEDDDDDEEDDEDDDFYRQLADRRQREREARERDYRRSGTDGRDRDRVGRESARSASKAAGAARTGSGMTEISDPSEERTRVRNSRPARTGSDAGMDTLPDVQAALEAALENQQLNRGGNTTSQPPVSVGDTADMTGQPDDSTPVSNAKGEIELAMPVRTADELLQKAYAKGLDPNVREDNTTGVTLVDYSDCL